MKDLPFLGQKYPVSAECHVTKPEFTDKSQTVYELLKDISQKVAACKLIVLPFKTTAGSGFQKNV